MQGLRGNAAGPFVPDRALIQCSRQGHASWAQTVLPGPCCSGAGGGAKPGQWRRRQSWPCLWPGSWLCSGNPRVRSGIRCPEESRISMCALGAQTGGLRGNICQGREPTRSPSSGSGAGGGRDTQRLCLEIWGPRRERGGNAHRGGRGRRGWRPARRTTQRAIPSSLGPRAVRGSPRAPLGSPQPLYWWLGPPPCWDWMPENGVDAGGGPQKPRFPARA